jgi:hypothetical protein
MKKFFKVLGIIALTLIGLAAIVWVSILVVHERVPAMIGGDYSGKATVDGWDRGYVGAKGTWAIDGEREANPLNVAEISCLKEQRTCYVASASAEEVFGSNWLDVASVDLNITRWDDTSIEYQDKSPCLTGKFVIDRVTEKVSGRRTRNPGPPEGCGHFNQDLRLSFVSGVDVAMRLRRERAPKTETVIAITIFVLLMLAWAVRVVMRKT